MDGAIYLYPDKKLRVTVRFLGGVVFAIVVALALFYWLLRPPMGEVGVTAAYLSVTAVVSVAAGYGAYRSGWISRSPSVSWTLLGGYALSSILTFLNVWVTATRMFLSDHDLMLATVLLLFAGGWGCIIGGGEQE